jgi:hypothetical protein
VSRIATSTTICSMGTNLAVADQAGCLHKVDLDGKEPAVTVLSAAVGPCRAAVALDGGALILARDNELLRFDDGKLLPESGQRNRQGCVDGTAMRGSLDTPVALCAEGSSIYCACRDDSVRLVTGTGQLATWLRDCNKAAVACGILDPGLRRRKDVREERAGKTFVDARDTLDTVITARTGWYVERREELDRKAGDKSLKGPDGVFAYTSHVHWLDNMKSFSSIIEYMESAGLDQQLRSLAMYRVNTMPVEHGFATAAVSGHGDTQTLRGYLAQLARTHVEQVKAHTLCGYE